MRDERPDKDRTESYVQLAQGSTVGRYRIIRKLGSGGMGDVYLAEDARLDRRVALKFLPSSHTPSEAYRARFKRETQAVARLRHPYIVDIYDADEYNGQPYFVMENVEGRTLKELIQTDELTIDDKIRVATQLCAGLRKAHAEGVVHRDIKPSNVIIDTDGNARLLDFGLAALVDDEHITQSRYTLGTVGYMSPEQARGEDADQRSDLFSLGVLVYEMIAGRRPFQGNDPVAVLHAVTHSEPEPLARYSANVPDALSQIVHKALQKDASLRYQSAADMLADLKRMNKDTESLASIRTYAMRRRKQGLIAAGTAVIIVAVLLAVLPRLRHELSGIIVPGGNGSSTTHLAILPLANIDDDRLSQAFCDGLAETMASKLTLLEKYHPSLLVIPASEIRRTDVSSVRDAREALGATMVVTGSLQRWGGHSRLTLNLVDAASERQVRSAVIDDASARELAFQDSLVLVLADMIGVPLESHQQEYVMAGGTSTPDAYTYYVEARGHLKSPVTVEQIDSAIDLFRQALAEDPRYSLAYAGLGQAYWHKFRLTNESHWTELAIYNSGHALELDDKLAPVHVTLGIIHRGMGEYEKAAKDFRTALSFDSVNIDAILGLAGTYRSLTQMAKAESCYVRATGLRPTSWRAHFDLVLFYAGQARFEDAFAQMNRVIALQPEGYEAWNNLGALYHSLGRPQTAREMWEHSLEIAENYGAASNLGALHYTAGQYVEAARMYEKALALNSRDYQVWMNLGAAYLMIPGATDTARAAYWRAIAMAEARQRMNPRDPLLLAQLADCYASVGEPSSARELLERAVALPTEDLNVIVNIGLVYVKLGDYERAVDWLAKASERGFPLGQIQLLPEMQELLSQPEYQKTLGLGPPAQED
jgi:tetratricopeptide (TPR) repeat protein